MLLRRSRSCSEIELDNCFQLSLRRVGVDGAEIGPSEVTEVLKELSEVVCRTGRSLELSFRDVTLFFPLMISFRSVDSWHLT